MEIRNKGQVWTPLWVAEPMAAYILRDADKLAVVYDPAVGNGALFEAASIVAKQNGIDLFVEGIEIDPDVIPAKFSDRVRAANFIDEDHTKRYKSIICNPPYVRHHRIEAAHKAKIKEREKAIMGFALDGRSGLHNYFLIELLNMLEVGGRLSIILPADTFEGVSSKRLWQWIARHYRIDYVVNFTKEAAPFKEDTNTIIVCLTKSPPTDTLKWVTCSADNGSLLRYIEDRKIGVGIVEQIRQVDEAVSTGLSRKWIIREESIELGELAKVKCGLLTGANDFFAMSLDRVISEMIPREYLKPTVTRTQEIKGNILSQEVFDDLIRDGYSTFLLYLDNPDEKSYPDAVQDYLKKGEPLKTLSKISKRKTWFFVERREPPPIMFKYLGVTTNRFVLNEVNALPLSTFMCVYPMNEEETYIKRLWEILNHPDVMEGLKAVGKSYGSGSIKVEPRALEKLLIPTRLLKGDTL